MAMYESAGYCPCNEFGMSGNLPRTHQWEQAAELLGDRIGFMVYPKDLYEVKLNCGETVKTGCLEYVGPHLFVDNCGVVDSIKGATDTLGVQIATALKVMLPICVYAESNCVIQCFDLDDREFKKAVICDDRGDPVYDHSGKLVNRTPSDTSILLQDERFCVLIERDHTTPNVIRMFHHKRIF